MQSTYKESVGGSTANIASLGNGLGALGFILSLMFVNVTLRSNDKPCRELPLRLLDREREKECKGHCLYSTGGQEPRESDTALARGHSHTGATTCPSATCLDKTQRAHGCLLVCTGDRISPFAEQCSVYVL